MQRKGIAAGTTSASAGTPVKMCDEEGSSREVSLSRCSCAKQVASTRVMMVREVTCAEVCTYGEGCVVADARGCGDDCACSSITGSHAYGEGGEAKHERGLAVCAKQWW